MRRLTAAALLLAATPVAAHVVVETRDLGDLSLEELANVQVISIAKRPTAAAEAPASVYVITADEIRRSGVTTLPEALRLAPNLQVARVSSTQYAISARGFNNAVGNKLLVLIDGRTVYSPVYSGVFWEMQDTLIEDVERIEVISGPGATLWGANAVNGVINIITRRTADTDGVIASADASATERGAGVRFGTESFRVYAKTREFDRSLYPAGSPVRDAFRRSQVGFRAEWGEPESRHTLQGDTFKGESEDRDVIPGITFPRHRVRGHNLLWRWELAPDADTATTIQMYWDHSDRDEALFFSPRIDIVDFDFQHGVALGRHQWLWGAGYRRAQDEVGDGLFVRFIPDARTLEWADLFLRDEVRFARTTVSAGLKLEHNSYTGTEWLPDLRVAWHASDSHVVWASASRAVRAPARYDRDVFVPLGPPFVVAGGPDFVSEVANVVELGLRGNPNDAFSYSLTVFHHDWARLRSGTGLPLPISLVNNIEGRSHGVEGWASWQVVPAWRVSAGFNTLSKSLAFVSGAPVDTVGVQNPTLHNDPGHQWMVRSRLDLGSSVEFDLHLYAVDELTVEPVPAYTDLDLRLAWRASPQWEVALVGRNLLDSSRGEFSAAANRAEFRRTVGVGIRWTP